MLSKQYSSFHLSRVAEREDLLRIKQDWISSCEKSNILFPVRVEKEFQKRISKAGSKGAKAKLNLSKCFLTDETVLLLIDALAISPVISKLDLRGNNLTFQSANSLKRLLIGQMIVLHTIDIDKRLHVAFLGECLLDKSGTITEHVLQDIQTLNFVLRKENAKALIRQTYFDYGAPEHISLDQLTNIWTKVTGKENKAAAKKIISDHPLNILQYDELESAILKELQRTKAVVEISDNDKLNIDRIMATDNPPVLLNTIPDDDGIDIDLNSDPGNDRLISDLDSINIAHNNDNHLPNYQKQSKLDEIHQDNPADLVKRDNTNSRQPSIQINNIGQKKPSSVSDNGKYNLVSTNKAESTSSVGSNLSSLSLSNSNHNNTNSFNSQNEGTGHVAATEPPLIKDKEKRSSAPPIINANKYNNDILVNDTTKPIVLSHVPESKAKKLIGMFSRENPLSSSTLGFSQQNKVKINRVPASLQSNTSAMSISLHGPIISNIPLPNSNNNTTNSINNVSHDGNNNSTYSPNTDLIPFSKPASIAVHHDKQHHDGVKWGSVTSVSNNSKDIEIVNIAEDVNQLSSSKPVAINTPPRPKFDRNSQSPPVLQRSPSLPNYVPAVLLDSFDKNFNQRLSIGSMGSRSSSSSNIIASSRKTNEKEESPMRSTFNPQNIRKNSYVPVDIPNEFEKPDIISPIISKSLSDNYNKTTVSTDLSNNANSDSNKSKLKKKKTAIEYLDFSNKDLKSLNFQEFNYQISIQEQILSDNHNIHISLSNIHTLILRNNSLSNLDILFNDLNVINQLKNLYDLDLAGNNFTILPKISINICNKLKRFDISYNHIVDVTNILLFQSLEYLNLSHNYINKIVGLPHKKLKFVDLSYNNLCSLLDIRVLSTCDSLITLVINNNPISKAKAKSTALQTKQFHNDFRVVIRSVLPKLEQLDDTVLPTHSLKIRQKKANDKENNFLHSPKLLTKSHSQNKNDIQSITRDYQIQSDMHRSSTYQKQIEDRYFQQQERNEQLLKLQKKKITKSANELNNISCRLSHASTASYSSYRDTVSPVDIQIHNKKKTLTNLNKQNNTSSTNNSIRTTSFSSNIGSISSHQSIGPNYCKLIQEWVDVSTRDLSTATVSVFPILYKLIDINVKTDKYEYKIGFEKSLASLSFYPKVVIPSHINQYLHNSLPPSMVNQLTGDYSITSVNALLEKLNIYNGLLLDISYSVDDIYKYDPSFESLKGTIDILMKTKDGMYVNEIFLKSVGLDYYYHVVPHSLHDANFSDTKSPADEYKSSSDVDSNRSPDTSNISHMRPINLLDDLEVSKRMDDVKRRISLRAGKISDYSKSQNKIEVKELDLSSYNFSTLNDDENKYVDIESDNVNIESNFFDNTLVMIPLDNTSENTLDIIPLDNTSSNIDVSDNQIKLVDNETDQNENDVINEPQIQSQGLSIDDDPKADTNGNVNLLTDYKQYNIIDDQVDSDITSSLMAENVGYDFEKKEKDDLCIDGNNEIHDEAELDLTNKNLEFSNESNYIDEESLNSSEVPIRIETDDISANSDSQNDDQTNMPGSMSSETSYEVDGQTIYDWNNITNDTTNHEDQFLRNRVKTNAIDDSITLKNKEILDYTNDGYDSYSENESDSDKQNSFQQDESESNHNYSDGRIENYTSESVKDDLQNSNSTLRNSESIDYLNNILDLDEAKSDINDRTTEVNTPIDSVLYNTNNQTNESDLSVQYLTSSASVKQLFPNIEEPETIDQINVNIPIITSVQSSKARLLARLELIKLKKQTSIP